MIDQHGFHGDSWIILLFNAGIFGIFAQNLPLWSLRPSLTVGMTKIPKILGLFHYFFAGISGIFPQNPAPKSLHRSLWRTPRSEDHYSTPAKSLNCTLKMRFPLSAAGGAHSAQRCSFARCQARAAHTNARRCGGSTTLRWCRCPPAPWSLVPLAGRLGCWRWGVNPPPS